MSRISSNCKTISSGLTYVSWGENILRNRVKKFQI